MISAPGAGAVAVFGSSEPLPGEPLYRQALEVGTRLARAGYTVLTGGYGGVMEAASRGAREATGRTVGVACAIFSAREPNAYLDEVVFTRDLYERSRDLIERADGYIVLAGKAGTLSELSLLWALNRSGCLGARPVVLLGDHWRSYLDHLCRGEMLETAQIEATIVVDSPEQAVAALAHRFQRGSTE